MSDTYSIFVDEKGLDAANGDTMPFNTKSNLVGGTVKSNNKSTAQYRAFSLKIFMLT